MKKALIYFATLYVASNLSYWGFTGPIQQILLVGVIVYPTLWFSRAMWGMLRFNYFPTPLQLMKGFKRIWPVVRKGPVVTRIHQPRQSSRTP
jgi:hypothetical protein